jgi:hypothetical protein
MLGYAKVLKKARPVFMTTKAIASRQMSMRSNRAVAAALAKARSSSHSNSSSGYSYKKFMYPAAALGLLSLVGGYEMLKKKLSVVADCCGIIGYIGHENIAGKIVLDGLQILQYRGYDS